MALTAEPLRVLVAEATKVIALDIKEEVLAVVPDAEVTIWSGTDHEPVPDGRPDLIVWALGRASEELWDIFERLRSVAGRTVFINSGQEDLPLGVLRLAEPFDAGAIIPHVEALLSPDEGVR